ncbi:MAG: KH domain-containing protein [Actinobacteria bacterium]|nr:KH domain-containing protein [Actinomycetota bacterium]
MSELVAEGEGETVGEAKWNALRELERLAPSLDKAAVRFQVLSEGERGLLGVGFTPARVMATLDEAAVAEAAPVDDSPLAARMRSIVEHVTVAMDVRCRVHVAEDDGAISITCTGGDLGVLIGRHGQTIDALQSILNAIAAGEEERKEVVVDAADYRARRRRTLESLALRAAEEALQGLRPVELEPMTAAERKLVHECLQDRAGVETVSEGDEPDRYVVVRPV